MSQGTPNGSGSKPYGKRLLIEVLEQTARDDPDRVCYVTPVHDESYAHGARKVTYSDVVKAVDRTAWYLESRLGKGTTFETIAYLGSNDIRYFIFLLGASKACYKLLLPSPRNSVENHLHLLKATECETFMKPKNIDISHIVEASARPLRVIDTLDLNELLSSKDVPRYPYDVRFEDVADRPLMVLHSSGSTGQVKPITLSHRACAAFDNHHLLSHEDGILPVVDSYPRNGVQLHTMPTFHAAGVFPGLLMNLYFGYPTALMPPKAPISVSGIIEALEKSGAVVGIFAPSILEDLIESPKAVELLSNLERVTYGGGALADHVDEFLRKRARLESFIGITEAGGFPMYAPDDYSDGASYLRFNPAETGIEFRPRDEGIYELVFVRHSGPRYSSIFDVFPDLDEWSSSDLWEPHPSKPGHWKHLGRADDVIVLSNGEKVVPSIAEFVLKQASEVRDVLLYGQKRFQVAAIIESQPSAQALDRHELLERLGPFIAKANQESPGHAQLLKDMVIFTSPEKPMARLPKGSVAKKVVFQDYRAELDELYSSTGAFEPTKQPLLQGVDEKTTASTLLEIFRRIPGTEDLEMDDDIFGCGFDSLKVITILRHIRTQLQAEQLDGVQLSLRPNLIYNNPTLNKLTKALRMSMAQNGHSDHDNSRSARMKSMLADCCRDFQPPTDNLTVVLTGSTGSVGSYLLDTLLGNSQVTRIICLNRAADGQSRQAHASRRRGLSTDWKDRVDFFAADLSKPALGLSEPTYEQILTKADIVIHTQWNVNFNLPVSSFQPNIDGVRNLIELATRSPRSPTLLFSSSIATAQSWGSVHPNEVVPERFFDDPATVSGSGYAEGKWISEGLLTAAASTKGVDARIVRVCQIAGSSTGPSVWNRNEWFPTLLASSSHLSLLPSSIGPMSDMEFVPVDRAAAILVEIALARSVTAPKGGRFYNMVNPHSVTYSSLLPVLQASLKAGPRVVPYQEWLTALEASAEDQNLNLEANPAVKLLDFFQALEGGVQERGNVPVMVKFSTQHTAEDSAAMQMLEGVNANWVKTWLKGLDL